MLGLDLDDSGLLGSEFEMEHQLTGLGLGHDRNFREQRGRSPVFALVQSGQVHHYFRFDWVG